jgi:hypothetical protein
LGLKSSHFAVSGSLTTFPVRVRDDDHRRSAARSRTGASRGLRYNGGGGSEGGAGREMTTGVGFVCLRMRGLCDPRVRRASGGRRNLYNPDRGLHRLVRHGWRVDAGTCRAPIPGPPIRKDSTTRSSSIEAASGSRGRPCSGRGRRPVGSEYAVRGSRRHRRCHDCVTPAKLPFLRFWSSSEDRSRSQLPGTPAPSPASPPPPPPGSPA